MSVRDIVAYPDERLRTRSLPVTSFDADLDALIDDLLDTLQASDGLGLSAPQLGTSRRVVVVRSARTLNAPTVLVNPVTLTTAGFAITLESCLSLPGVRANVMRPAEVRVRADDRHGVPFESTFTGLEAICTQHEIDHLDGRLFIDHVSRLRRWRFRRQLAALSGAPPSGTRVVG